MTTKKDAEFVERVNALLVDPGRRVETATVCGVSFEPEVSGIDMIPVDNGRFASSVRMGVKLNTSRIGWNMAVKENGHLFERTVYLPPGVEADTELAAQWVAMVLSAGRRFRAYRENLPGPEELDKLMAKPVEEVDVLRLVLKQKNETIDGLCAEMVSLRNQLRAKDEVVEEIEGAGIQALRDHCEKFILDEHISCPEAVYQSDNVIENAYEFIEGVCKLVGYYDHDSGKVVKP